MDENVRQVTLALQGTLQQDPNVRKQAEHCIWEFEKASGFASLLLQLVCSDKTAPEIRMAAAVTLKNFIKKNWDEAPEVDVSAEEEEQIRNSILQAMFLTSGTLQSQLSHAVHLMAKRDFPSRWPSLVPSLVEHLKVDDLNRLVAALSAMDQLFKKFRYESKSTSLWTELKSCLLTVQEPLTQVYAKMIEFIPQRSSLSSESLIQWLEILCLVCKVFHSLCFQDLPEYFEDNLKPWVEGFLEIMKMDCPGVSSSGGEPTFIDELKMEVCEIFTLYAQRFEEEINPFMQNIIQAVWQLVVQTGSETRFDGMGVLQTIAQDVCVKNLHLRQEDLEMFEDEPIEYLKRDIEG
ncbi:hypothetical protein KIN20_026652 [Parelaphostrongylus tenuis]|uniref:Importin N-terminal domain-containing protein n=1 Tax=Parelaphostrongylus tenuis TaxID=148309 RepID=A0AAD5WD86_PARTN|nr:hypothetical protein KIN20_026652 [Parelaphostrongylus tenuis]